MKITQAVLFLALIGSASAHAARTTGDISTGEMKPGTTNCAATLDKETAEKKAQAQTEVKRVYAEAKTGSSTQTNEPGSRK
ncbi:MAG: hypothetical protein ACXVA9_03290 [Bdellovibrionales bacterium]